MSSKLNNSITDRQRHTNEQTMDKLINNMTNEACKHKNLSID